ncbi:unnamed protein product [Closterium sp. NIES-64]|nr:unnamed protein product [Closterium sp. NIES-64]
MGYLVSPISPTTSSASQLDLITKGAENDSLSPPLAGIRRSHSISETSKSELHPFPCPQSHGSGFGKESGRDWSKKPGLANRVVPGGLAGEGENDEVRIKSDEAGWGSCEAGRSKTQYEHSEARSERQDSWHGYKFGDWKQQLARATELDVRVGRFDWSDLVALYRTEVGGEGSSAVAGGGGGGGGGGGEGFSDAPVMEKSGSVEVTINSGGIVYFALFQQKMLDAGPQRGDFEHKETEEEGRNGAIEEKLGPQIPPQDTLQSKDNRGVEKAGKEWLGREGQGLEHQPQLAAACIKFAGSRIVVQSERFGAELAMHLGIATPQLPAGQEVEHVRVRQEVVVIDSSICRRVPPGLAEQDREAIPRLVQLLLHDPCFAAHTLFHASFGALGEQQKQDKLSILGERDKQDKLHVLGSLGDEVGARCSVLPPVAGDTGGYLLLPGSSSFSSSLESQSQSLPALTEAGAAIESFACTDPASPNSTSTSCAAVAVTTSITATTTFTATIATAATKPGAKIITKTSSNRSSSSMTFQPSDLALAAAAHPIVSPETRAFQQGFREAVEEMGRVQRTLAALHSRLDDMLRAFLAFVTSVPALDGPGEGGRGREGRRGGENGQSGRLGERVRSGEFEAAAGGWESGESEGRMGYGGRRDSDSGKQERVVGGEGRVVERGGRGVEGGGGGVAEGGVGGGGLALVDMNTTTPFPFRKGSHILSPLSAQRQGVNNKGCDGGNSGGFGGIGDSSDSRIGGGAGSDLKCGGDSCSGRRGPATRRSSPSISCRTAHMAASRLDFGSVGGERENDSKRDGSSGASGDDGVTGSGDGSGGGCGSIGGGAAKEPEIITAAQRITDVAEETSAGQGTGLFPPPLSFTSTAPSSHLPLPPPVLSPVPEAEDPISPDSVPPSATTAIVRRTTSSPSPSTSSSIPTSSFSHDDSSIAPADASRTLYLPSLRPLANSAAEDPLEEPFNAPAPDLPSPVTPSPHTTGSHSTALWSPHTPRDFESSLNSSPQAAPLSPRAPPSAETSPCKGSPCNGSPSNESPSKASPSTPPSNRFPRCERFLSAVNSHPSSSFPPSPSEESYSQHVMRRISPPPVMPPSAAGPAYGYASRTDCSPTDADAADAVAAAADIDADSAAEGNGGGDGGGDGGGGGGGGSGVGGSVSAGGRRTVLSRRPRAPPPSPALSAPASPAPPCSPAPPRSPVPPRSPIPPRSPAPPRSPIPPRSPAPPRSPGPYRRSSAGAALSPRLVRSPARYAPRSPSLTSARSPFLSRICEKTAATDEADRQAAAAASAAGEAAGEAAGKATAEASTQGDASSSDAGPPAAAAAAAAAAVPLVTTAPTSAAVSAASSPPTRATSPIKSAVKAAAWRASLGGLPSRLSMKIRGVRKSAQGDEELREQVQRWDGMMREEAGRICKAAAVPFVTGFMEASGGGGAHSLVDAYELKVRLHHLLERWGLVQDSMATERPSLVLPHLYLGSAIAARSFPLLHHLSVRHVVTLCPTDLLDPDAEQSPLFNYLVLPMRDSDREDLSKYIDTTSSFLEAAISKGEGVLVHCYEGRSRSVSIVLAYLMTKRRMPLAEAWVVLQSAHPHGNPTPPSSTYQLVHAPGGGMGGATYCPPPWRPQHRLPPPARGPRQTALPPPTLLRLPFPFSLFLSPYHLFSLTLLPLWPPPGAPCLLPPPLVPHSPPVLSPQAHAPGGGMGGAAFRPPPRRPQHRLPPPARGPRQTALPPSPSSISASSSPSSHRCPNSSL